MCTASWGFWGGKTVSTGLQKVPLIFWFDFMQVAPCRETGWTRYLRISPWYISGESALLEEKEHNDNNSLLAGRYAWRITQPYIYISYRGGELSGLAWVLQEGTGLSSCLHWTRPIIISSRAARASAVFRNFSLESDGRRRPIQPQLAALFILSDIVLLRLEGQPKGSLSDLPEAAPCCCLWALR